MGKQSVMMAVAAGLLLPSLAWAFDAHQIQVQSGQGELARPLIVLQPWTAPRGTFSSQLTFEYASNPLEQGLVSSDGLTDLVVPRVANLSVLNMGLSYGVTNRLALSAGIPLFLRQTRVTDLSDPTLSEDLLGAAPGDLQLSAPIRIAGQGQGFVFSLVPQLELPLGDQTRDLGDGGPTLGAVAAAGWSTERFNTAVNLGARLTPLGQDPDPLDEATVVTGVTGLSAGFQVHPKVGIGAEFWAHPGGTSTNGDTIGAAEAVYHVDFALPGNTGLVLAASHGLGDGAGTSSWRGFAGVRYSRRPSAEPIQVVPVVRSQETPFDLRVVAQDDQGKGLDAELIVTGEGEEYRAELGRDGEAVVQLAPGEWQVTLEAEGYGTQTRTMVLDEDRFLPPTIEAVLHQEEGEASLDLVLEDAESQGVNEARVDVDGSWYGNTSTEGTLIIGGLSDGEHEVAVQAEDFEQAEALTLSTGGPSTIVLERPPGSVKVIVRSSEGAVVPALVRFVGPEQLDPEDIGPTGEKIFVLDDGDWTVVVSSEEFGLQQREVQVDSLSKVLRVVDIVLTPDLGNAELHLTVIDPDGEPVQGARVMVDGQHRGSTSNGGSLVLAGLEAGELKVSLQGERMLDEPEFTIELGEGVREVLVTMDWKPGTLQVITRGRGEIPVDALVRFEGPESLPAQPVGADGEAWFELVPGAWTIAVSAEALGLQEREVSIEADETSLVVISAVLREDRGDAVLSIRVTDPKGNPIDGARVALDGEPVGTTSTGGTLTLAGLAPGDSVLEVAGVVHEYQIVDPLEMAEGDNEVDLVLAWLAGTISVITRGPEGPVDALVRAYGPAVMAPVRTGIEGDRVLYLEPGEWTVVASSELLGIEQEEVHVEAGQDSLVPIEFTLNTLEAEEARFVVSVVDPDGSPIAGASLSFGADTLTTPEGGSLILEDAARGELPIQVSAPGYQPITETLSVVGGNQTRTLTMQWVPQPVTVRVQSDKGETLQATVKWVGPVKHEDTQTDAQGNSTVELRPGSWTLIAQAPDLGAGRAELLIVPGVRPDELTIELVDSRVQVVEGEVKILEQVFFDTGLATIRPESYAVLDEVANVLLLNPQIELVEVQGHTDNVGTDDTNLRLSARRAQAVRDYLVSKGVKRTRLVAKGYGNAEPIADNSTEEGRSQNRRVQFEIVEESD